MSRARRAGTAAAFGYLQFGLSMVSGILLVPFVLAHVANNLYGVWLAFGEVLAYSAMADLGVAGVVPWLVAEADGRRDREAMRGILTAAVVFSTASAVVFVLLSTGALWLAPSLSRLPAETVAAATPPLLLMVALLAVTLPLRALTGTLVGLQDAGFMGILGVSQVALNVVLTVLLLLAGYGLWALALASAIPSLLAVAAAGVRLHLIAPELLREWRLPGMATLRQVTAQGLGAWTAGLGWRLVAASDSMVILSLLGPGAAVVFALTAKLGTVGMQLSWQIPDAGLVGLAQLRGEGQEARVREVTLALLRLLLVLSGGVACAVVAFNASFVSLWVGPARFGGMALNAAIAAVVLAHSFAHGLFSTSATLGARVQAGWAVLLQGGVNLALALLLGRLLGLPGVALAAVASTLLVACPAGVWMLRRTTGLQQRELWLGTVLPWGVRAAALLLLGAGVSLLGARVSPWLPLGLAPLLGALYLWGMRALYADLPLPPLARAVIVRLRLLPATA